MVEFFAGTESDSTREAKQLAASAQKTAKKLSDAEIEKIADRVTDQLRAEFENKLAPARAADLAKKVKEKRRGAFYTERKARWNSQPAKFWTLSS